MSSMVICCCKLAGQVERALFVHRAGPLQLCTDSSIVSCSQKRDVCRQQIATVMGSGYVSLVNGQNLLAAVFPVFCWLIRKAKV